MSNWIKVTNLPFYYDEEEAVTMFGDVGSIKRIQIERVQLLLKSTAFIQFVNAKKARLAAIKKDQIVFADAVIRVYVVWNRKESLTTVKVSNLPSDVTEVSLMEYFSPYGDIVDIDFNKSRDQSLQENEEDTDQSWCDEKMNESMSKEAVAFISFARVDYALRACQEMDHSIISSAGDNSRLSVKLANPDARNAKWKRNLFEYVRCTVPSKRTRTKPESGVKLSTKINNSFTKENVSRPHQSNSSECWFTSQVNATGSKTTPIFPPMSGSGVSTLNSSNDALKDSRFDNSTTVPQTHSSSVPRLIPNKVPNANTQSNFMLCGDPRFGNGGMVSCGYTSLVFPNTGFVSNGNINTYLTVPHNANFGVSTPPLSSGLAYPTQMITTSPNTGPFLSTQVNNIVDNNYAWSQNQIPTLPSIQVSGTTSVPSVISNQSTSSSLTNSTQKVVATDSSNTTSLKKTTSVRSTASVSSCHSNASSSSVWSNKQREMGDIIYRELQSEFPNRVAKLTGMLLSLPEDELSRLLTDSHKLKARALQFCQLLDSK